MRGRIENAQAGRGCLTDELRERYRPCTDTGYAMGPVELGLVPYLHHLAVNRKPLDRWAISAEEFVVLAGWEQHGWISVFGTDEEPVAVTKGFWDFMCSALWDTCALHLESPAYDTPAPAGAGKPTKGSGEPPCSS